MDEIIRRVVIFMNKTHRRYSREQYLENIKFDVMKLADYDALVPPRTVLPMEEFTMPLSTVLALTPSIACHQCITTHELHHRLTTYFNYLRTPHNITFDFASPASLLRIRLRNTTTDTTTRFINFMRTMIGRQYVKRIRRLETNVIEIHLNDIEPTPHYHERPTPADVLDLTMRVWLRELQQTTYIRLKQQKHIPLYLFYDPIHVKAFLNYTDVIEQLKQFYKTHEQTRYHMTIFDLIRFHPTRTCDTSTRIHIDTSNRLRIQRFARCTTEAQPNN